MKLIGFFFAPDDKCVHKRSSRTPITMKLGTLLVVPKTLHLHKIYFGTIPGKIQENMTDS